MAIVDANAGPCLAAFFGRRMVAERKHAGAEYRAAARQRHFALQGPRFGHWLTPVFRCSSSTHVNRPMARERRYDEGDAAGNQRRPDDIGESLAATDLLECHHHTEGRYPDHVHDADREHQQHHRPATAKTIETLYEAKSEHAARRTCPVAEEERERTLALRQAGVLECGELVRTGGDEDYA